MLIRWLTALFVLFLGVLTWMAQRGDGGQNFLFSLVGRIPYGDKLGHFVLMGILSLLVNLWWSSGTFRWQRFDFLKGSVLVAVLVTLEELSQYWQPNRTLDLWDWLASMAGVWCFGQLARWSNQQTNEGIQR